MPHTSLRSGESPRAFSVKAQLESSFTLPGIASNTYMVPSISIPTRILSQASIIDTNGFMDENIAHFSEPAPGYLLKSHLLGSSISKLKPFFTNTPRATLFRVKYSMRSVELQRAGVSRMRWIDGNTFAQEKPPGCAEAPTQIITPQSPSATAPRTTTSPAR